MKSRSGRAEHQLPILGSVTGLKSRRDTAVAPEARKDPEQAFVQTLQIGIVVRDLAALADAGATMSANPLLNGLPSQWFTKTNLNVTCSF